MASLKSIIRQGKQTRSDLKKRMIDFNEAIRISTFHFQV
jgi:hypothetical protein